MPNGSGFRRRGCGSFFTDFTLDRFVKKYGNVIEVQFVHDFGRNAIHDSQFPVLRHHDVGMDPVGIGVGSTGHDRKEMQGVVVHVRWSTFGGSAGGRGGEGSGRGRGGGGRRRGVGIGHVGLCHAQLRSGTQPLGDVGGHGVS